MISESRVNGATGAGTEVAWYTVVGPWCRYDQGALLRPRLAAIRRRYPGSRIMVQPSETVADTVARWRDATADLAIDWLAPRPVHAPGAGDAMIAAMLGAYLDDPDPAEFLIKVDLDARVHRRFRSLPRRAVGVFGTLEYISTSGAPFGEFPNVQGGCYGMSRETARLIRDGGVLGDDRLKADPGAWTDGVADWIGWPGRGITLEDGLLRWISKRMGLRPFPYDEIDSRFLPRPPGLAGDYAVTHPHKALEPDEGAPSQGSRGRVPTS